MFAASCVAVCEAMSPDMLVGLQTTLYLHAGCPAKGRLPTLHSLDLAIEPPVWKQLPSAPEPGRGGTNLALLPLEKPTFARFGGFAGAYGADSTMAAKTDC